MKFLKRLVVFIIILFLVLIIGVIIFIKTFDVTRFKPQIISQVSKALNRQVDFEKAKLDISLRQGISLRISNLAIEDDQAFQIGNFLAVKDIFLSVDFFKYFSKKIIDVPNVLIDSPRMVIIRQKDGSLNLQSIARAKEENKTDLKAEPYSSVNTMAVPAILISSVKSTNGTIIFIDNSFEPALSFEVKELSFSLNKISLTDEFPFLIEAAVLSAKKNIKIEGKLQIDLKTSEVIVFELKGESELSELELDKILVYFPMAKGAVLPLSLKGKIDLAVDKFTAGQKGLSAFTVDASLVDGFLQFKEMVLPVKDLQINVKITEKDILLDKATAGIGDGLIKASGKIEDYLVEQVFNLEIEAQNLKVQDLVAQDKLPVKAEGIASSTMKFKGSGFSQEALKSNLIGDIDLSVIKAKLKDINMLSTVLDKVLVIPGLAKKIESKLPERFKEKFSQKDTNLRDIKLPLTILGGHFVIKDTVLGTEEFLFKGKGEAGFDSSFLLEGSFLIPQELSAEMVASVPELQFILNENKEIYIPLNISGKKGEIKFKVDPEYCKRVLVDQAKQQIFKAIDKYLGPKENEQNTADTNYPATQQSVPQESEKKKLSTEEIIGNILDKYLKK